MTRGTATGGMLAPDARLRYAEVDSLPDPDSAHIRISAGFHASAREVLLDLPTLARWRIRAEAIEVALHAPGERTRAIQLSRTTPLAMWSWLRNEPPMSAFAAVAPGAKEATLVCGRCGSGRSTTLVALLQRGWTFLADDVVRLDLRPDGVHAFPGHPAVRLWRRSCRMLGIVDADLPEIPSCPQQVEWEAPSRLGSPCRVDSVVVLRRIDERGGRAVDEMDHLRGFEAIRSLGEATVQPGVLRALPRQPIVFATHGKLADSARIRSLRISESVSPEGIAHRVEESLR